MSIDYPTLSCQLVRELRGTHTGAELCEALGFSSHVLSRWESGERVPTAADVFRLADLTGRPVRAAVLDLNDFVADELGELTPVDTDFVPAIMRSYATLVGRNGLGELAELSRFQVGRVLQGTTRVRLPTFLRVLEEGNRTLAQFLLTISDPTELPALREAWLHHDRLTALRSDAPFLHAMTFVLSTTTYRALASHSDAWVARVLGLPESHVRSTYARAMQLGLIVREGEHYVGNHISGRLRHRLSEEAGRQVGAALTRSCADRFEEGHGRMSWRFFRASDAEVRGIAGALASGLDGAQHALSAPEGDRVGLAMVHLVALDGEPLVMRPPDDEA